MLDSLKKLYIEPTSRCNLSCSMCFRNSWLGEAMADMPLAVFHRALHTMPQSVETIFFGGMGEPLCHPDILNMVQDAAATGRHVAMVTNATLLTPKMSHGLLQAGLGTLWVSIDSFESQQYETIRKNSTLNRVTAHLRAFNQAKKALNAEAALNLTFVVMKSNMHQLAAIPYFVASHNIGEVNISHPIPTDATTAADVLYSNTVGLGLGDPFVQRTMPKIHLPLMDWRQPGLLDNLKGVFASSLCSIHVSGQPLQRAQRRCRFVEEGNAFVKHDGSISPCMALLHSAKTYWGNQERTIHHHAFGNVLHEGLQAIWESQEYTQFRDTVRRFEFSPCFRCTPCDDWEENRADCFGNSKPTCGACLWSEGLINCP